MYEFITIGGGEYFVDIFNGLAMVVKSGDFLDVIKISAVLAFMISLLNAALMGSLYDSSKWFLTTIIVTQTLLYPTATIHVTDKTNSTLVGAKVDNVPFVIAYTAATSSQIGYSLTKLFESVYSLPNDLQYTENGMIFGANLMNAMTQARVANSRLSASLDNFSRECIFYDIFLNIYSFDDLKNAEDVWNFVKSTQVENRFFTYTNHSGTTSYPTCKAGAQLLEADWKQEFETVGSIGFYAKKPSLTKTLLVSAAPLTSEYLMNVSKSSEQILQQAMMINAISDATENLEAENQVQNYQNARATLQAKSTYQTMGTQAGMWIPMLKIVIESVFYGAFPLVILLCMIPSLAGGVLRGYFVTFFWLASWGPIYAILHRISMGHAKTYILGADWTAGTGVGLNLGNQMALQQTMSDIAAMAGYMSMFVPMLAYGIAKGGAAAMSSMTTSFMSGVQGAVSTAAHEGTTGNLSFGNVGLNSKNVSSGISITNDAGQTLHRHNDGTSSIDNSKAESRLGFELHGSERVSSEQSRMSSQEQSFGQSKSVQAQMSSAQGHEMMINNHRSIESSQGFEQNFSSEQKESFSKINTAATDFAVNHNINREKSAEIFASVGAGKSFGVSGKILASDAELYSEAQKYAKEHHLSKDFQTVASAMQSNRFNLTDSKGESINESFNKSASLNKEASQHFEASKRYSEQAQYSKSHSVEIDKNYNQELWGGLVEKYGNSGASNLTNPSNQDKAALNKEIDQFMSHKVQEVGQFEKPNLESEYNRSSSQFVANRQPSRQMQNEHSFTFTVPRSEIDNSHLQQSAASKFNNTQQIINDAKVSNLGVGREVIGKVTEQGNEGVILGVIDETATNGEKVFDEALNTWKDIKK
jgi:conjugal transfer mating pair stabilization protein TraG